MTRTGFGYDVHRLVEGRPLMLGGVQIPSDRGLDGHSDADVLLHAITDALLGAAVLGDIGSHFPDTDLKWKGADSAMLLATVVARVRDAGFNPVHLDATIALQQPKLRPFIDRIRQRIAEIVEIPVDRVSVKATTTEGMGFVGTGEGAAAYAVCTVEETK